VTLSIPGTCCAERKIFCFHLRLDNDDYNAIMVILETIKCEIKWWLENIEINNIIM
jgi:hypothetical protein